MGNLIFFNAIKMDYIVTTKQIDLKTTNIYTLGAPMKGSVLLKGIAELCSDVAKYTKWKKDGTWVAGDGYLYMEYGSETGAILWAAENVSAAKTKFKSYCNYDTGKLHPSYESLLPFDDPQLVKIGQDYTKGAICGTNTAFHNSGVAGDVQSFMFGCLQNSGIMGQILQETNDGDVITDICKLVFIDTKKEKWSTDSTSLHWEAPYRHEEIKGNYQDNMPDVIQWLRNRE